MERIFEKVQSLIKREKKEGFLNQFDLIKRVYESLIFVIIFMYKKEIMDMLNLK